jgi:TPR repeat protein
MKTEKFKKLIMEYKELKQWNKILNLIIIENLKEIFFQVYGGEALMSLGRISEAKKILEDVIQSANKKDPKEMFLLGKAFQILEDDINAFYWYKEAAELNEVSAQNNLACYYLVFKNK